jgi:hypothetical protein
MAVELRFRANCRANQNEGLCGVHEAHARSDGIRRGSGPGSLSQVFPPALIMTHLIGRVVLSIVGLQVACELISVKMYNDDSKQEAFVNAALSSKVGEFNCVQKAVFLAARVLLLAPIYLFPLCARRILHECFRAPCSRRPPSY